MYAKVWIHWKALTWKEYAQMLSFCKLYFNPIRNFHNRLQNIFPLFIFQNGESLKLISYIYCAVFSSFISKSTKYQNSNRFSFTPQLSNCTTQLDLLSGFMKIRLWKLQRTKRLIDKRGPKVQRHVTLMILLSLRGTYLSIVGSRLRLARPASLITDKPAVQVF